MFLVCISYPPFWASRFSNSLFHFPPVSPVAFVLNKFWEFQFTSTPQKCWYFLHVWAPPIWMRPQLPQEAGGDDEFEALRGTLTTNEWDINNQLTTHCQPISCPVMGPWLRSSWNCALNPKYINISNLWSSARMLFVYENTDQWWLWRWWWQWGARGHSPQAG